MPANQKPGKPAFDALELALQGARDHPRIDKPLCILWTTDPAGVVTIIRDREKRMWEQRADLQVIGWLTKQPQFERAYSRIFKFPRVTTDIDKQVQVISARLARMSAEATGIEHNVWSVLASYSRMEAGPRKWICNTALALGAYYYGGRPVTRSQDYKLIEELLAAFDGFSGLFERFIKLGFTASVPSGTFEAFPIEMLSTSLDRVRAAHLLGVLYPAKRQDSGTRLRYFVRRMAQINWTPTTSNGSPKAIADLLSLPGMPADPLDHRTIERLVKDEKERRSQLRSIFWPERDRRSARRS